MGGKWPNWDLSLIIHGKKDKIDILLTLLFQVRASIFNNLDTNKKSSIILWTPFNDSFRA